MTTADDPEAVEPTRPQSPEGDQRDLDGNAPSGAAGSPGPVGDDDLVGGLLRNVDSRFSDLEQQYRLAREDLTPEPTTGGGYFRRDAVAESSARYELVQEVATLRADLARQSAELDERDRLLGELSNRLVGFEDRLRGADEAVRGAKIVRQELHEERRELARVRALLDARVAERDELADAAQRLQTDNDDLDRRLAMAVERFDEVDRVRSALADDVAALEAARSAESQDHSSRLDELSDTKAEVRRLNELVDELTVARDEAHKRADRSEHDVERRANEVGYLNRRIESLTSRAEQSDDLDAEVRRLTEENRLLERRVDDLTRDLDVRTAEATAAARAVEAIADQNAQNETLIARVAELEAAAKEQQSAVSPEQSFTELHDLAGRARALGARRTAGDYEPLLAESIPSADLGDPYSRPTAGDPTPALGTPAVEVPAEAGAPAAPAAAAPAIAVPQIAMPPASDDRVEPAVEAAADDGTSAWAAPAIGLPATSTNADAIAPAVPDAVPDGLPAMPVSVGSDEEAVAVPLEAGSATHPDGATDDGSGQTDADDAPAISIGASSAEAPATTRRRVVLPAQMAPDTTEAVTHLLSQPGLTAIVDARSFCATTGIRPSELFDRMQALRDRFDLPVEVVVTPVSTPVGGAPELPAIGVHHVTGADTVSDRVRALCIGFPRDQQLVVIAGDDHVRRAAIGEEANVVDPTVVLDVT